MKKNIKISVLSFIFTLLITMGAFAVNANAAVNTYKEDTTIKVGADMLLMKSPGENLKWTSSNANVVYIRSEINVPGPLKAAIITAKKAGKCTITAKSTHYKYVFYVTAVSPTQTTVTKTVSTTTRLAASASASSGGMSNTPTYSDIINSLSTSNKNIVKKILTFKSRYPEGSRLTNEFCYYWNGGIWPRGYGCAGFAMMLSDNIYPSAKKATLIKNGNVALKTGDIVGLYGNAHYAMVLGEKNGYMALAEANYNSAVRWGRIESKKEVSSVIRR